MGIDPHVDLIPSLFGSASDESSPEAIRAIEDFCLACLERAKGHVPAVKPQAAFFEAHGPEGMGVLARLARAARDCGLLVVMDAKRGDIGSTSSAYAKAWLGEKAPFAGDALTLNAYLGLDTLKPFLEHADEHGCGVFVLVRTSNEGAGDIQDLDCDGKSVFTRLAQKLAPLAAARRGASGWSSLGVVVGATWPEQAAGLRRTLADSPFLVPGFGAQGAGAEDALAGLVPSDSGWQGGLVNSTRALIFPQASRNAVNLAEWNGTISEAIAESKAALSRE